MTEGPDVADAVAEAARTLAGGVVEVIANQAEEQARKFDPFVAEGSAEAAGAARALRAFGEGLRLAAAEMADAARLRLVEPS